MPNLLFSWIGSTDLRSSDSPGTGELGPIAHCLQFRDFDEVFLLNDHPRERADGYVSWLTGRPLWKGRPKPRIKVHDVPLPANRKTDLSLIDEMARQVIGEALRGQVARHGPLVDYAFLLSPGTPAMQAVFIVLGQTTFPRAELVEARFVKETGQPDVKTVRYPFGLEHRELDLQEAIARSEVAYLERIDVPGFETWHYECPLMGKTMGLARRLAFSDLNVFIHGETGSGKEGVARYIHDRSFRGGGPPVNGSDPTFLALNCAAIPEPLAESLLFGHKKGSFTGAATDESGLFEQANGGTLFLDEVGDLSPAIQNKLLRVLESRMVTRVGDTKGRRVDVRVISASSRDLGALVAQGTFRIDLFYRLNQAPLRLPSLQARGPAEIEMLATELLKKINERCSQDIEKRRKSTSESTKKTMKAWEETGIPQGFPKEFSPDALVFLGRRRWRGNIRELQTVIKQAVFLINDRVITEAHLRDLVLDIPEVHGPDLLDVTLGAGFNLEDYIDENLLRPLVRRAMEQGNGTYDQADRLLGTSPRWVENLVKRKNWPECRSRHGRATRRPKG